MTVALMANDKRHENKDTNVINIQMSRKASQNTACHEAVFPLAGMRR
jgi:hypothetical protein